jgi:hypothetical protein
MRNSLLLAIFILAAACQPRWQTLVPGQEERFAQLVEPGDGELREDWEWHNAWVDDGGVTVTYGPLGEPPLTCREAPICLRLAHPTQGAGDDLRAGEFVLQPEGRNGGVAILADGALVEGLATRLEAEEGFWQSHLVWAMVLLEGGLAVLFLLVLAGLALRRPNLRVVVAAAGVTTVSFALRWLAVPVGPFHENHHGLINVHSMVTGGPPFHHVTSAHFALMQWLVGLVGGGETTFYAFAALLSALAVPLWALVARRLADDDRAGWLAAAGLAIMPLVVRMAPTATPFVLATLLLPASALALAYGIENWERGAGWVALALAILFMALLAQTRIWTLLLPPVAIALGLAMAREIKGRQWLLVAAVAMDTALLASPHLVEVIQVAGGRAADARYIGLENLLESLVGLRLLPFRPDYVAPTLLPLAILGCGWLFRHDLRRGLMAGIGLLWLLLSTGLVSTCTSLHLALELPLLVTLTALSALGIFAIGRVLPKRAVAVGATIVLLMTSLLPWSIFSLTPPESQEYRFITDEVLGYLQVNDDTILYVAPERDCGREVIPISWWQRQLPTAQVRAWQPGVEVPTGAFIYRGLSEVPTAEDCLAADSPAGAPSGELEVAVRAVALPEARFLCGKLGESSLTLHRQNGKHRALIRRE